MAIPALGSVISVRLFEDDAPVEKAFESGEEYKLAVESYEKRRKVMLKVRMVGREPVRSAAYKREQLEYEERVRLRDLREKYSAEDRPELHKENYMTEDGSRSIIAHMREDVMEIVVGISGLDVDGVDMESERDATTIADVLDQLDLLVFAYYRALGANQPKASQLF